LFGSSVNVWRSDITAVRIFSQRWQDEEQQLRMQSCAIQKESYLRFLQEMLREMRELKEKHNSINEEATEYGLVITEPAYLRKH
jgi:Rod binding domain-containing protein